MPKKIIITLFIILILSVGRLYAWKINNFEVNIDLNQDSSILVTEKILADFSDQPKHGIIRNIPIRYRDRLGNNLNLRIKVLGVYDENYNPWMYREYGFGIYKVLKIGNPNITYNSQKMFIILYKVKRALLYFNNHDELYWNAIGSEWDVAIKNAIVNFNFPKPIKKEQMLVASYSGKFGSRSSDVETQVLDEERVTFKSEGFLPYEGVTIVVGWPKGVIRAPGIFERLGWFIFDNWFFIIPLVVFLVMFDIWRKYGKDPKLNKSVVVEYKAPEKLAPAEVGTLIDDKTDIRDISATIIDLAVRGYLRIVKEDKIFFQKKYLFVKLKDFSKDESLKPFEIIILKGIFHHANVGESVGLSQLENNFYENLSDIKEDIFDGLIESGFYKNNPEKTVLLYRGFGIATFVIAFFSMAFTQSFPIAVSIGLSALIIFAFAKYMPAKTRKGMDVYGKVLGFEEFLNRTDKDKIQFEERQNIFEKMLPYAVCLGISTQWANIFADIYQQSPAWFVGDYRGGFYIGHFMHDLNGSLNSMNSTFASMPRSVSSGGGFGGGGFSGGGFGGGGGSSW